MTIYNSFPINGVSISNLPGEDDISLSDVMSLVHSGVTNKVAIQSLLNLFRNNSSYDSAGVLFSNAISLTTNVISNVVSLSLDAGTWLVSGNLFFNPSLAEANVFGWSSETSVTLPDPSIYNQVTTPSGVASGFSIPQIIYNLESTTVIYLSAKAIFGSGIVTVCGSINAAQI
jgi:hypothetical protein